MRIVIALGGNALRPAEPAEASTQLPTLRPPSL